MRFEEKLERVYEEMEQACARCGRTRDEVTLVAVTKTFPFDIIEEAYAAGLRHFGENRVQELTSKSNLMPGTICGGDVHWHMIGHIQRKKARDVVQSADLVHGLDSFRLAEALNRRAEIADRILPVLLQVNVSSEESKFGVTPDEALAFAEQLIPFEHLQIKGLMTLASPTVDPETIRPQFRLLRTIYDKLLDSGNSFPHLEYLSMGMSGDFGVAIEEGATHIRVGSALFGSRS